ncbi:MAG: taurine dioxygenase [Parasphingorhabdus sp.]|jgi:taurine dioxygenase
MNYQLISPRPLSTALGAQIADVDLSQPLTGQLVAEINQAFLQYQVVFFPAQKMDPQSLVVFAKQFGELARYPFVAGMPEHPDVVEVIKKPEETINFGGLWHTDTSYLQHPPKASIVYARVLPPIGGDTLFANMYQAWDALSDGMQLLLSDLSANNSAERASAAVTRVHRKADRPGAEDEAIMQAEHPVVRTHPETGRKTLYCSDAHTISFSGWSEQESRPLLQYLYSIQQAEEFCFRYSWRPGDLAMWDNRCVQHNALNDYQGYRRELLRVTLEGERPS